MDCTRYNDLVEPLLDPELDGGRALRNRDAMREHDRWCPTCRDRLETTWSLFAHLSTMAYEPVPPGFAAHVLAAVRAAAAHRKRLQRLRLATAWVVGGASVAVVTACQVWKDATAVWLFGALGRLATWWYSWAEDLVATMRHTVPADLPLVAPAILRAACAVLDACVVQMLVLWFMMTVAGIVLRACTSERRALATSLNVDPCDPAWRLH